MADRQVTHSHKDKDGDIIGLCWKSGSDLKYVSTADAISHIVEGTYKYFVSESAPAVWVLARPAANPTYLTTEADDNSDNNLDNLDDCQPAS